MQEKEKSEKTLSQQLADFKQGNPKVTEAMELFGITEEKYQEALHALYAPRTYQSDSTVSMHNFKL